MDKKAKLLLVDDSTFMRNVLKNILQEAGFDQFIEAENGEEAIEKFKSEKPDLVLLDIIMPKKGGIDVLKELNGDIKAIVVSAVGQDKVVEEAKQLGAVGYIVKPFDNKKVLEEVEKALA